MKTQFLEDALELGRDIFTRILEKDWQGADRGIWRPGYSVEEHRAAMSIAQLAESMGAEIYQDLAGNIHMVFPGQDRNLPVFMTGSHLDAVPNGGRYDGPAGVVAGLAAVKSLQDEGIQHQQDIVVTVWRSEESPHFGKYAMGSHMATAQLGADVLDKKRLTGDTSKTLADSMRDLGMDPEALRQKLQKGEAILPIDHIDMLIEAHIQQQEGLAENGHDVGVVTGIRGNVRSDGYIEFYSEDPSDPTAGKNLHTGGASEERRRNAAAAAIDYAHQLEQRLNAEFADKDLVHEVVDMVIPDPAQTSIPARAKIKHDIRSVDIDVLNRVKVIMEETAKSVAKDRGLSVDIDGKLYISPPYLVEESTLSGVEGSITGLKTARVVSGAGHDASVLGNAGVNAGMIFIAHGVDNAGASHTPIETMTTRAGDDPFSASSPFAKAVWAMREIMRVGANNPNAQRRSISFVEALLTNGAQKGMTPLP